MADSKVLTISIAAYNVESYIRTAIESCLIPDIDLLDIIVVDDGATDSTAVIADEYSALYPNSISVVRKKNGGYGSTVNHSIKAAKGEFFKLLDGDDWYDPEALSELVNTLKDATFDVAINPFIERFGDNHRIVDQAASDIVGVHPLSEAIVPRRLSMHSITYRTQLLRDAKVVLPEHRLYTDTLYNVMPLPLVRTVHISHSPVYQYRLGRDGQSMSLDGLISHREDMKSLVRDLNTFYKSVPEGCPGKGIVESWLVDDAASLLITLFLIDDERVSYEEVDQYLNELGLDDSLMSSCRKRSKRFTLLQMLKRKPLFKLGRIIARCK